MTHKSPMDTLAKFLVSNNIILHLLSIKEAKRVTTLHLIDSDFEHANLIDIPVIKF